MDDKTREMVREWVNSYHGDIERTARWMARSLHIGPIRECRELIKTALS